MINAIRGYIGRSLERYYSNRGKLIYDFASSREQADTGGMELINQIRSETELAMTNPEAYLIYLTVKKTEKIKGDVAEIGVYKGGSAKLISNATQKQVHLFDTFEGLPDLHEKDRRADGSRQFVKGAYEASLESAQYVLKDCNNVHFYKGIFPDTSGPVKDLKFSFVHLDVDIYQSAFDSLEFFYTRMNRGGCIISHDYQESAGIRKAFDEFYKDKPEIIIEPYATGQALVVKV